MILSNFKISFLRKGEFVFLDQPEDYLKLSEPETIDAIASTTDTVDEYTAQVLDYYAYENNINGRLLVNEGHLAAIGAQIKSSMKTPYVVLHFCNDEAMMCLIEPTQCTLSGSQLTTQAPVSLLASQRLPIDGLHSYMHKRYNLLITSKEEERVLAMQNGNASCPKVEIQGKNAFAKYPTNVIIDWNEWVERKNSRPESFCKSIQEILNNWASLRPAGIYVTGDHQSHVGIVKMLHETLDGIIPVILTKNAATAVEQGHAILHKNTPNRARFWHIRRLLLPV